MYGRRNGFIAASLALAMSTGVILGQDADPGVLGGPQVEDAPAEVDSSFGPRKQRAKAQKERPAQKARAFQRAVRQLAGQRTPEELRPTEEQAEQIKAILGEHREQMRVFLDEHKDQIETLRKQAGLPARQQQGERPHRGRKGGRTDATQDGDQPTRRAQRGERNRSPDAMQDNEQRPLRGQRTPPTPEQKEARLALAELMKSAPPFEPAAKQVLAVLDDEQVAFVKEQAKKVLERARKAGGARGARLSPEQRQKLAEMSPQERRQANQRRRNRDAQNEDPTLDLDP